MSTALGTTTTPTGAKRRSPLPRVAAAIVGVGVVAVAAWALTGAFDGDEAAVVESDVYVVQTGNMVVSVSQPGQVEARNKEIIRSQVSKPAEVAWLIKEGADVKAGDVLIRLDTAPLEDDKESDEQSLESARSSLFAAEVAEQNTISQSSSDVEKAQLDYEFAQLALKKYLEGEYPQQIKQAEGEVKLRRDTLLRAKDKMDWSSKLYDEGYITQSEANADAAAYDKAQLDLEVAEGELEVLKKYTHYEQRRKLESDVEQKKAALERVTNKAKADKEKAKVDVATARSKVERLERKLADTIEDLKNCEIKAPVNGRVVYAQQGSRWRREEPVSEGATVRSGQELIHLPEAGAMSLDIKIDEAQRSKVQENLPVLVTGPNLPEAGLRGRLVHIAEYLDPSGWWNNYDKKYSATVDIDGDVSMLRTGMNCQSEIIVAYYEDVITVPLQAVLRVDDQHVVYDADTAEPIPVTIGLDNGSHVHVVSGLTAGRRIMLNPPLEASQRDAADETARLGNAADAAAATDAPTTRPAANKPQGGGAQRPGGGNGGGGRAFDLKQLKAHAAWKYVDDEAKKKIDKAIADGTQDQLDQATKNAIRKAFRKYMTEQAGGSNGGGGS